MTGEELLLKIMLDSAYDALLVLDQDFRVLALNAEASALFNCAAPEGRTLIDVTGSPELESVVRDTLDYDEESFEDQIGLDRRAYRVRARVARQGDEMLIGLALQDVSELVRLNRARREMIANISHELRHPIANIRLIIDSLFHEDEKPKRKRSISSLQAIARETDSLLWIMQEMLDLSMIESGQAIFRMVDVPLRELVNEAIERMDDQSAAKDLKFVAEVQKRVQVLCDRDQIRRVLLNLIHNAIKWSPPNGTITVRAAAHNDEVTIEVLDNGPGVPDEQVDRIFERFYQVDMSRSGGEGTGLGLAICKHIVEAHGGRIWAQGRSHSKGGHFLFTLARAENEQNEG